MNTQSGRPSSHFLDAVRHHEAGSLGTAERLYKKVLDKEPGNADAWYLSGFLALQRHKVTAALAQFDKAVRLRPDFPDAQYNRAVALMELGRVEEAVEGFGRAVACPGARPEASNGLAQALARLVGALRDAGRHAEALPHVLTYGRMTGDAELLSTLATEAIERGRPDLAHAALVTVTGLRPDDEQAHVRLAKLCQSGSSYAEAEAAARRAVDLNPNAADGWSVLGQALFRQDRLDEARTALTEACRLAPEDAEARHFLSLLTGAADDAAKTDYVRALFDSCADSFETVLVDGLGYAAPQVLAEELRAAGALDHPVEMVDLGCGTGLCAKELKPFAKRIDGIDLAPRMVEIAQATGLYDRVIVGEMTEFLRATPQGWGLAVAGDVLIYVGESTEVFAAVAGALRPGGCFAFSVEVEESLPVAGRSSGRFAHSDSYIRDLAKRFGFQPIRCRDFPLRTEVGRPILGRAYVLRAA